MKTKTITLTLDACWDEIAFNQYNDEFEMQMLIEGQYSDTLLDYVIIPADTTVIIPESVSNDYSASFKAPWE